MMYKILSILVLFSVGCTHVAAGELSALKLYPVTYRPAAHQITESGYMITCTFQLKGTKSKKIEHFAQFGVCSTHDSKDIPADLKDCTAVSAININNNQMVLRQVSYGGPEEALYKKADYTVEIKSHARDCEEKKVSCTPFYLDAVLTVKKGALQQTFDMQGSCPTGEDGP